MQRKMNKMDQAAVIRTEIQFFAAFAVCAIMRASLQVHDDLKTLHTLTHLYLNVLYISLTTIVYTVTLFMSQCLDNAGTC
jgi:hypothetical protein